jgi:MFS family permease
VGDQYRVHADVLKLGLVSFLTDLSSEMIFSVFAVVFTSVAGASSALLGIVEGFADLSASSLDVAAGWLSDRTGKRKPFAVAGYAFSTLAKSLPLAAVSMPVLAGFRIIERLGKSFRGPPRDAWLSAITEHSSRGYSFGVHKALDKAGAVLGPLAAFALLSWRGANPATYRMLFWVAFIPAILSVGVFRFIRDRPAEPRARDSYAPPWRSMTPEFHRYLGIAALFSLGYFSFGFLLLRAYQFGFSVPSVVLLYALFNAAFVLAAPLAGKIGDRVGRTTILMAGYLIYGATALGFSLATARWQIIGLFIGYGVFYSIDEAQSKALIADIEPLHRGTAIGLYNFITGAIYLPASVIAGLIWLRSPAAAFAVAAGVALAAAAAMTALRQACNTKEPLRCAANRN